MRIVALDLVRFFAALSVVLYHYTSRYETSTFTLISEVTKYGYLGVPLFFIISGYVIALSANNRTAIQFAISRFVRLYPALWAGVIFTVLILAVFTDKQHSVQQIFANFTLLNEYLGFEDIDGVYWTLKVELKFYACIFLLLAAGVFTKHQIWLSLWLALTVMHTFFGQPFFMGWFISPSYSSFFIAGIAFFLMQHNGRSAFIYFIIISSLITSSFRAYEQAEGFMINPNIGEKLTSVAVVWLFYLLMYFLSTEKLHLKERSIFITLGAITYPLYLIHNTAGKAIIDYYSATIPEEIIVVFVAALMLIFSWSIYLFIEKPFSTPLKIYLLSMFNRTQSLSPAKIDAKTRSK